MAYYVTMLHEGCPNSKAPPNAAFFSLFLEDTLREILCSLTYPKILCVPEKGERKKERKW